MHDELFEQPAVGYRAGPYAESRERFLRQARANGYSQATLGSMAWALLVVAEAVHRDGGSISYERLRSTLRRRVRFKSTARPPSANTAKLFLRCAKAWLRSIGALTPEAQRPLKFAGELHAFTEYMRVEQGLSPTTIAGRDGQMRWFCASLPSHVHGLRRGEVERLTLDDDHGGRSPYKVDGCPLPPPRRDAENTRSPSSLESVVG